MLSQIVLRDLRAALLGEAGLFELRADVRERGPRSGMSGFYLSRAEQDPLGAGIQNSKTAAVCLLECCGVRVHVQRCCHACGDARAQAGVGCMAPCTFGASCVCRSGRSTSR